MSIFSTPSHHHGICRLTCHIFDLEMLRAGKRYYGRMRHPQIFRYMFATNRKDAFTYPVDLTAGKSPTLNILHAVVARMMEEGTLAQDDVFETSLAIWAHAHGLITLYLSDRIKMPRMTFRDLYMRSLNRLVDGIRGGPSNAVNGI
ncbi:MAG TPA: TetR-like C-terminal domain-containing protein [Steroidobacteraceae bacterium]|nr:TetR-like C-terminal domain-containing protein [Steroidobacteraceae bacterium]